MANLTLAVDLDTLLQAANFAAARTVLSLGALSTVTPGTGVATAAAINVGSAGAFVVLNGALGTPSSGTLTSATGLPISTGLTGAGTGVLTALAVNVGSAGAFVTFNGAGGTPSSLVLTNATGAVTASIVDAAVTLAKMANLAQDQFIGRVTASTGVPETATITAAARTVLDDTTVGAMVDTLGGASATGTGGLARATSPTFVTPILGTPTSGTVTNLTGTASININGTVGATTPAAGTFTTVVAGSATSLLLGTAGSAVGSVGFRNATSGTITLSPTTGALGTIAIVVPANAGTIAVSATSVTATQAMFATTTAGAPAFRAIAAADLPSTLTSGTAITSAALTTPVLGTPTSGALTNCTADGTNAVGYRNVPQNAKTGSYTLLATDVGKVIPNTTGGWTVNNSVHAAGDVISVYNDSASSQNITAGTITTMRLAGTTTTGTRALAARGLATLYFQTATEVVVSGAGVT